MKYFALLFTLLTITACSEVVPVGYVGMRKDSDGLDGEVLEAGRHGCGVRCQVVLLETREMLNTEKLNIMCTDDLNIAIDVKTRSRLKVSDGAGITEVLNKQGAKLDNGTLRSQVLYEAYVRPAVRAISRTHVSKYSTTQIRKNRAEITAGIQEEITKAMEGTPVEITFVATSNIDYPIQVTAARVKAKERELEIMEEDARREIELKKADNDLKIAMKQKAIRVANGEAEAAYNTIITKSITPNYLRLREIEARTVLYQNAGPGDKVIITPEGVNAIPVLLGK
jgi:hypothetical protein